MGRSFEEIKQEIIDAKEADAVLNGLTSTSNFAIWRLWVNVIAFTMWVQEGLWDAFKVEVTEIADSIHPHTVRWYRDTALSFRDGKSLIWNKNRFEYPELADGEDLDTLQVVKQCAVLESPGKLQFKIATESSGVLAPVAAAVKTRFEAFMNQTKDAGNIIEIVNELPDNLNITATIYVDPLVIDLDTGALVSDSGVKPVEVALNDFLKEESNVNFNGALRRTFVQDAMQKAEGVIDPVLTSLQSRYAAIPFSEVTEGVVPFSGYFAIDTLILNYEAYGA